MGARTTETNRQGRVGQTSCTNVHKANLGSQLSIFHTGCFARAGPRPNEFTRVPSNDPPERFCMGARTTETNRQGRAGQTSCTNVHKANLGSQLSIFYTALARTTRPNEFTLASSNDPPERVHTGALKLPARTVLHGRPNDRNEPTRESRANDSPGRVFTRQTSPLERVHMGSDTRPKRSHKGDSGKRAARSLHEAHPPSQLSTFYTTTCALGAVTRHDMTRPDPFARAPTHDTSRPARTKFGVSMGARPERNFGVSVCARPERNSGVSVGARPEQSHEGASGKRATRTCRGHTSGHDLAFLARPRVPGPHTRHDTARPALCEPTRPARTRLHGHPHTTRHDPTRTKFGVSLYAQPERNLGFPWVRDPNEGTRQRRANGPHERVEGTRGVMT
jgi:hypothetical protein